MYLKLISASDLHIRLTRPTSRKDNFFLTQTRKVSFMLNTATRTEARAILLAGDVFDNAFIPYKVIKQYIELFNRILKGKVKVISVFGQHDMRYHSLKQLENTPLSVLLAGISGVLAGDQGFYLDAGDLPVCIKGASFGQPIPSPDRNCFNILLIHRFVTREAPPFSIDFVYAKTLLRQTGYDLIISGDNHERFIEEYRGRVLINNGSLVRLKIDQKDFQPCISQIVINQEGNIDVEWIEVPIKPGDMVFERKTEIRAEELLFDEIAEKLQNEGEFQTDFTATLLRATQELDDERMKFWIHEILASIEGEKDG